MMDIAILLKPRWLAIANRRLNKRHTVQMLVLSSVGLVFWIVGYAISLRVLTHFQKAQDIGDLLAFKLLSIILITVFSLMIFSTILTSLSKLYLSRDLLLAHALPVPADHLFFARWIESTIDSAWMVILFTLPILLAYGRIYSAGPFYYVNMILVLSALCIIASAISALVVQASVWLAPASRLQSLFVILGFAAFIVLYIAFRLSRPERLVDPETFSSVLYYMEHLRAPSSRFLPSAWCYQSLRDALLSRPTGAMLNTGMAWSFAIFLTCINLLAAGPLYFKGYSRSQTASFTIFQTRDPLMNRLFAKHHSPFRGLFIKEVLCFFRDQTQWSQLFLIGALIIIYVYNYSVLPLEKAPIQTAYLQNLLSFLNMALAGFVLTAVTARFAFPAVSSEGPAFWIIRSSPASIKSYLWIKFFIYLLPMFILAEILIVATNLMLNVTPWMMALSVITIALLTPAILAMGIGLGAAYPDFNLENPAQAVTSFGGMTFMMLSSAVIGAVVILEAGPVYRLFMAGIRKLTLSPLQKIWLTGSFTLVVLICVMTVILSMRYGIQKLENRY